jgi:uncharacterized membrane protein
LRLALFALTLLVLPLGFHTSIAATSTPDFTLSAFYTYSTGAPSNVVVVTGENGFSGTVTLTLSSPAGFTASLTPSTATLTQSVTSVNLSLVANGNAPGNYLVNITATSGSLVHSLTIHYNIVSQTSPNFIVDSNLGLTYGWDILRGSTSDSTIHVISTNGFTGTASLQASSFPSGLTGSFVNPTVKVQPGQPGITSLKLSAPAAIPVGVYTVVLTGTSGPITQVVYLDVIVTYGFALKANPTTLTLPQGGLAISIIALSSQGGWTGTTGLIATCPGITCILSPPNLQLSTPDSTAQSTLTVSATPTTLPGRYTVDIAETGPVPAPSFTLRTDLTIIVTGPDFTISANPGSLTFSPGMAGTMWTTITLTSLNGFSGYVNTTISVTVPPNVGPPFPHSPTVTPNSTRVKLTPTGPQSFTITVSVDSMVWEGPYIVQIKAVTLMQGGLLSHEFGVMATVGPDFSISASSANLIIHQGTLATSTITFTSLNGFAGGIMLLLEPFSALPPDPKNYFFPTYPILSPGGTNSTELVVIADQFTGLGTFNAWVDASTSVQVGFGWISHAFPMIITIEGPVTGPDFTLSALPSHVNLSIGSTTNSTISLKSVNSFSGALTLQAEPEGVFGSLSPTSVTISPTLSSNSALTITSPAPYQIDGYPLWYPASGERSLLIIASNSTGFSHWARVNATEAPVSVVPTPTHLDIPTGSSATSQIIVSSLSGYNLTVAMSAVISPSGPITSLTNSFINFSASIAPVSLALTINVPSTATRGDYVVLVTATSMSHQWYCQCGYYNITYTTPIYVRAVAPSSAQPGTTTGIFGLPPIEFYGIISAVAIAIVITAGYLRFLRPKKLPYRKEKVALLCR